MSESHNITALILCGGFGTRLHTITHDDLAKPMVSISGRPFLEYLLDYLSLQGIQHVILAVGHQRKSIIDYFGNRYGNLRISYSIETQPLGTGGAIQQALKHHSNPQSPMTLVLNGDTFIAYSLAEMLDTLATHQADMVMLLQSRDNTDRYGRVSVGKNQDIVAFQEKQSGVSGLINTGVYLLTNSLFETFTNQQAFSFEKDFLEHQLHNYRIYATYSRRYFIDIGTPEDYYLAQRELIKMIGYNEEKNAS